MSDDPFDGTPVSDSEEFHELDKEQRLEIAEQMMEESTPEPVSLSPGESHDLSDGVRVRRTTDGSLVIETVQ